jgi:hypothetical protein
VSDRKVLADIDWWRVTDGQREQGGEEEDDEEGEGEERVVVGEESQASVDTTDSEAIPSRNVEPERPSTPVASESPLSEGDDHIFGYSFQVKETLLP